jgi:hypothetical protein
VRHGVALVSPINDFTEQVAPVLRVAQLVREKQAEDEQRARLDQEMQLARQIQHSLLPRELPALAGWKLDTFSMLRSVSPNDQVHRAGPQRKSKRTISAARAPVQPRVWRPERRA